MFKLISSVCIDAPVQQVWAYLARLEDIQLWSEAVMTARCDGPRSHGVGAERTCDLAGGITIKERWLAWEEGRSFAYEGVGIPLVERAQNEWIVQPQGDRTLLTTGAQVILKGGPLGKLLEPLLAWQSNRMGQRTLAAFKYLVEHGEPPLVKHSKLPRVSASC